MDGQIKFLNHPEINGLIEIQLPRFSDERGSNAEGYNRELYKDCDPFRYLEFPVDSYSWSKIGVLRGGHGDFINTKLITLLFGKIQFVVIDKRLDSSTYGEVFEIIVDADNKEYFSQFLVPNGCCNFHACLSERCCFSYKLSSHYVSLDQQIHVKWNSPEILKHVKWKIEKPLLSERDK